ncbi:MAG TPA: hypothetical protein VHL11_20725 [Phototrophicaceae bacterium]|jgi:hypothetical protein|nr:hypothetical protein [Phototrophicaceae bacterium]
MSETTFKGNQVTRDDILQTIKAFDSLYSDSNDYEEWQEKESYKYAIIYKDKLYPPKHILSEATGVSTSEFSGGEPTNRVFRQLGFEIIDKP